MLASAPHVKDSAEINSAVAEIVDTVNANALAKERVYIDADLVIGVNRIGHGLGRPVIGIIAVPRDPDPGFSCGFDPAQLSNPIPDRQVFLDVVGGPMRTRIFVF